MSDEQTRQLVEAIAYALDKQKYNLERELQIVKDDRDYQGRQHKHYYDQWLNLRSWLQENHPKIYKKSLKELNND